jgi:hypothetical protein
MSKPRLFIASSSESLAIADSIQVSLDHDSEVTVWKNGFGLSSNIIDNLLELARGVDFAVFVFTPDDLTKMRGEEMRTVRDNVLFELGLFIGTLTKERCIIVSPRGEEVYLPTDLLGVTSADFEANRTDSNLEAAVNAPCTKIRNHMLNLGKLDRSSVKSETPSPVRREGEFSFGLLGLRILAEVHSQTISNPCGVAVHEISNKLKDFEESGIHIVISKLERHGFLTKSVETEQDYEYYGFALTENGMSYLLDNSEGVEQQKSSDTQTRKSNEDFPF